MTCQKQLSGGVLWSFYEMKFLWNFTILIGKYMFWSLQLLAAGLFKYVWFFSGHQQLTSCPKKCKCPCYYYCLLSGKWKSTPTTRSNFELTVKWYSPCSSRTEKYGADFLISVKFDYSILLLQLDFAGL